MGKGIKKIVTLLLLLFLIGFATNIPCKAQTDQGSGWSDEDPADNVPLSGSAYFFIAALGIGAFALYNYKRNTEK
jgi:hypothetical protein